MDLRNNWSNMNLANLGQLDDRSQQLQLPPHPQISSSSSPVAGYFPPHSHAQAQDVYTSSPAPFTGFSSEEQSELGERFRRMRESFPQQQALLNRGNSLIPQDQFPPFYGYPTNDNDNRHYNYGDCAPVTIVGDDGTPTQSYIMNEQDHGILPPPPQFLTNHPYQQQSQLQQSELRYVQEEPGMIPYRPSQQINQQTPTPLTLPSPNGIRQNIYENATALIHGENRSRLETCLRSPTHLPNSASLPQTSPMNLGNPNRMMPNISPTHSLFQHELSASLQQTQPVYTSTPLIPQNVDEFCLSQRSPQSSSVIQHTSTATANGIISSSHSPSRSRGKSPAGSTRGSRRGRGRGAKSKATEVSLFGEGEGTPSGAYVSHQNQISEGSEAISPFPPSVEATSRRELFAIASSYSDPTFHIQPPPQTPDPQHFQIACSLLDLNQSANIAALAQFQNHSSFNESGAERGSPRGRSVRARGRGRGKGRGSPQKVSQDISIEDIQNPDVVRRGRGRGRGTRGRGVRRPSAQDIVYTEEVERAPPEIVPLIDIDNPSTSNPNETIPQPINSDHLSSLIKSCDNSIQIVGSTSQENPSCAHAIPKPPSPDITSPIIKEEIQKLTTIEPKKESEEVAEPDHSTENLFTPKAPSVVTIKKKRKSKIVVDQSVIVVQRSMQNVASATLSRSLIGSTEPFFSGVSAHIAEETMKKRQTVAGKPKSVPSIFELKNSTTKGKEEVRTQVQTGYEAMKSIDQIKKEPSSPDSPVENRPGPEEKMKTESIDKAATIKQETNDADAVNLASIKVEVDDIEEPSSVDSSCTVKLRSRSKSISEISDKTSGKEDMSQDEDIICNRRTRNKMQTRTSKGQRGGRGSARARRVLSSESKSSGNEECTRRTTRSKTAMQKSSTSEVKRGPINYAESSDSDYSPTRTDANFHAAMKLSVGDTMNNSREIAKARRGRGFDRSRGNVTNITNLEYLKTEPESPGISTTFQTKIEVDYQDENVNPDVSSISVESLRQSGTIKSEYPDVGVRMPASKTFRPIYSPEEKELIYGDRAFVIDQADMEKKPEDMYVWRIMKPEKCLMQFYPSKYGGRVFHISTSTCWYFFEEDFTSEEFYQRFQPIQVDIAKEKVVFPETKCRKAIMECTIHVPYMDKFTFNRMLKQVGKMHKTEYLRQDFIKLNHLLSTMVFYPDSMTHPLNAKVVALIEPRRRIESVINEVTKKATENIALWTFDFIENIQLFPVMKYSTKNIPKSTTCSACKKRTPMVEVTFWSKTDCERPYDRETFQYLTNFPASNEPFKRFYWCRECSIVGRKLHRLVHYLYGLYLAIRRNMAKTSEVLQRNCGQQQITDVFLIWTQSLEMNWICDQFMEFRLCLAEVENEVAIPPSAVSDDSSRREVKVEEEDRKENSVVGSDL